VSIWAKIGGGLLVLAAFGLVVWMHGKAERSAGASDERAKWEAKVSEAERGRLAAYQAGVASVQVEEARYSNTVREVLVPVTKTIIERTAAYAATPQGAAVCLPADRVQLLTETRSALFPAPAPAAPDGAARPVRPDTVGN
jgi:hypothetical protein